MIENIFTYAFLLQTLRISVPYFLPSLGAAYSEKGGVVNIGLEGILLTGAFFTTLGTYYTQNIWIGILCGLTAGFLIALIHGIATITFKADQIVSGIALNLFALGLTKFLCRIIFNSSSNSARIPGLETVNIPLLSSIPILNNIFITFCIILLILSQIIFYRSKFGLRLRAVGENPAAADSLGINVLRIRYAGVLISGLLAGLGGAWLAFDQHSFTDGMSAGRGFIALAAMIVGKWKPMGAAAACLVFGFAESISIQFQGTAIPTQFIQMLPYILTIIILAGFIGKSTPPAADGIPYENTNK
ncbi:MAG: ABC transporter permease [Ignavibacteriae bacterium]|nr:MAG: ABC transporter permease [Ignavibacteriota bacterium]